MISHRVPVSGTISALEGWINSVAPASNWDFELKMQIYFVDCPITVLAKLAFVQINVLQRKHGYWVWHFQCPFKMFLFLTLLKRLSMTTYSTYSVGLPYSTKCNVFCLVWYSVGLILPGIF